MLNPIQSIDWYDVIVCLATRLQWELHSGEAGECRRRPIVGADDCRRGDIWRRHCCYHIGNEGSCQSDRGTCPRCSGHKCHSVARCRRRSQSQWREFLTCLILAVICLVALQLTWKTCLVCFYRSLLFQCYKPICRPPCGPFIFQVVPSPPIEIMFALSH